MTGTGAPNADIEVIVLEARAVDEMVAKVKAAASRPGCGEAVAEWRAAHADESGRDRGHDFAVVNQTLMYLYDAPDGMVVPYVRYPDGTEKVYTDAARAGSVF